MQISITDSYASDFISNKLMLLAEVAVLPVLTTAAAARKLGE